MRVLISLAPFIYLWWMLIDHLRVEWTVNPQYAYGWAVPFLCVYLAWRRWSMNRCFGLALLWSEPSTDSAMDRLTNLPTQPPRSSVLRPLPSHLLRSLYWVTPIGFIICAFLVAPTKLIEEANPEWRLVSWALALEVIALTLFFLRLQTTDHTRDLTFPLLYFLVAVPWPSRIEFPLIESLTRMDTAATIEVLGWFGIPALQHGNVIEISRGMVGIDDACSGIRSLQATLMISLFVGEFYRFPIVRRVLLCLGGFALALCLNIFRTSVLTFVVAKKGASALSAWHDPTGVSILLGCFFGLWIVALLIGQKSTKRPANYGHPQDDRTTDSPVNPRTGSAGPPSLVRGPWFKWLIPALAVWLVLTETGVELWYRVHEKPAKTRAGWTAAPPKDAEALQELSLPADSRSLLRPSQERMARWRSADGNEWQMIFLQWKKGRAAAHLAQGHMPEGCLTAVGKEVTLLHNVKPFAVGTIVLPFRVYRVRDERREFYLFYCLSQDASETQGIEPEDITLWQNRWANVRNGRRNLGQRSLELAVPGIEDESDAEAAVARELEKVISVDR